MALGFGSTKGAGTTDAVRLLLTAHATLRTYAMWAFRNGDGGSGFGRVFDKLVSTTEHEVFLVDASVMTYRRTWSSTNGGWTIPRPSGGVWHHLAITYDTGSSTNDPVIYVDGVSQTVTEISIPAGTPLDNADAYVLGNRLTDSARNWDGMLAEVGVWNALLTLAQIEALAKGWSPVAFPSSLVSYSPMVANGVDRVLGASTVTGTAVQPHIGVIYPAPRTTRRMFTAAAGGIPTLVGKRFSLAGPRGLAG